MASFAATEAAACSSLRQGTYIHLPER